MLAVSGPSLLHYLGWSSARVNYRGAPESCVTKDGRQNTVKLPCPVQQRQEEKAHLLSPVFFFVFFFFLRFFSLSFLTSGMGRSFQITNVIKEKNKVI